jgi:hypothetical protein
MDGVVTYGIDYDGTTISDKTKSQELKTHLLGSFYRS